MKSTTEYTLAEFQQLIQDRVFQGQPIQIAYVDDYVGHGPGERRELVGVSITIEAPDKPEPEVGQVYQSQLTREKFVVRGPKGIEKAKSAEWIKVADEPHGDGDMSYCCGSDWCRCMQ